jgi:hypothetical protein
MATKWVGQCSLLPKFQTLNADESRNLRLAMPLREPIGNIAREHDEGSAPT